MPDGERRLTNLLHLAELLHHASIQHNLSPEGLVKWLETRCHDLWGGEDAEKLRLESDARAVRIITIHKSKGLEFDVVFCPFTWSGVRSNAEALFFHDPEQADRLTLAIGPGVDSKARIQSQKEELAENIRLLYVALTRARHKCYLVWGRINQSDVSAPAFLFHGKSLSLETDDISTLRRTMSALSDAGMIEDLKDLEQKAQGAIAVSPLPRSEGAAYQGSDNQYAVAGPRICDIAFDTQWRIASYSAMTAQASDMDDDWPDRDAGADRVGGQGEMNLKSLFDFPKGVRTGLFFHDLLEQWQMDQADPNLWQPLVQNKLHFYGFDEKWMGAVKALLPRLASQPLPCQGGSFALKQVVPGDVVKEMVFHFPLKPLSADRLRETFIRYGNPQENKRIAPYLERLRFSPVKGFMKGFVDMVFRYDQRYYLVDWKSNYLGHAPQDYAVPALERVMAADLYFLQYYIYIVALDAYLRKRINHYSYERHFGGVFYIFIRGLQDNDPSTGIYHARPQSDFIDKLRALLLDFES
jgi:exodeoxyribonuclease V beta subunit